MVNLYFPENIYNEAILFVCKAVNNRF